MILPGADTLSRVGYVWDMEKTPDDDNELSWYFVELTRLPAGEDADNEPPLGCLQDTGVATFGERYVLFVA